MLGIPGNTSMTCCMTALHTYQEINSSHCAERAKIHYEIGTRHILFSESACSELKTSWAAACPKAGELVIHESHQDCVTRLPEGAVLLASSKDTRVEVWALGDHVLCIQGQMRAACTPLPGP